MEERLGEMRKGRRERIEKGSHCFFKSSGYDKLELKHKNLVCLSLNGARVESPNKGHFGTNINS